MAQTKEVRGVATSIFTEDGTTHVQYHSTRVVSFNDRCIVLRSGGHQTNTTKTRMNQTANQFGLDFKVYQHDFDWFVTIGTKTGDLMAYKTVDFVNGMTIDRETGRVTGGRFMEGAVS